MCNNIRILLVYSTTRIRLCIPIKTNNSPFHKVENKRFYSVKMFHFQPYGMENYLCWLVLLNPFDLIRSNKTGSKLNCTQCYLELTFNVNIRCRVCIHLLTLVLYTAHGKIMSKTCITLTWKLVWLKDRYKCAICGDKYQRGWYLIEFCCFFMLLIHITLYTLNIMYI